MTEYIVTKANWPTASNNNGNDNRRNTPAYRVYQQLIKLREGGTAGIPVDGPKGAQNLRCAIMRFRKRFNPDFGFRTKGIQKSTGYVLYIQRIPVDEMRHPKSLRRRAQELEQLAARPALPPLPSPVPQSPEAERHMSNGRTGEDVALNSNAHHTNYAS